MLANKITKHIFKSVHALSRLSRKLAWSGSKATQRASRGESGLHTRNKEDMAKTENSRAIVAELEQNLNHTHIHTYTQHTKHHMHTNTQNTHTHTLTKLTHSQNTHIFAQFGSVCRVGGGGSSPSERPLWALDPSKTMSFFGTLFWEGLNVLESPNSPPSTEMGSKTKPKIDLQNDIWPFCLPVKNQAKSGD